MSPEWDSTGWASTGRTSSARAGTAWASPRSAQAGPDHQQASEQAGVPAGRRHGGRGAVLDEARERALSLRDAALGLKALLDRPLASYYLVLGCTLLLLAVGLMMVLSTSTAYDLDNRAPPYSIFEKQLLGAVAGLALMWLLAKAPPRLFRDVRLSAAACNLARPGARTAGRA